MVVELARIVVEVEQFGNRRLADIPVPLRGGESQ